ncbi:ABC transporter permease [Falsihalocynthiibacter sp. S25ZX9]|uniref:ABC transporter permease n=1 Tax=Falsihalocynthiibacter sp. S25ZX9 TaxID=3240870 RepID=UPI0035108812
MNTAKQQILSFSDGGATGEFHLSGHLTIYTLPQAMAVFECQPEILKVDISGLERLDTGGAWFLLTQQTQAAARGQNLVISGASAEAASLFKSVEAAMPQPDPPIVQPPFFREILARIGERVVSGVKFLLALTSYLGIFLHRLGRAIRHPSEFRLTALVHHCEEVGLKAVPIVALMAFLIGVVLAFQGSTQLKQFGAEVFVVDLIAVSILRELGILLTSIIVAGRTASAFTAAIGSMKMREEIDAMRTLGLDPAMVLFVPRILALLLMLPILGLIADISGLFGGALMAWIDLGISPEMFKTRLVSGTSVNHVLVGLVKAPFFALIIGVVGCHAGMQVESNAESLGRMTSNAVVTAIFAVIVADAVFSIFFASMGI